MLYHLIVVTYKITVPCENTIQESRIALTFAACPEFTSTSPSVNKPATTATSISALPCSLQKR